MFFKGATSLISVQETSKTRKVKTLNPRRTPKSMCLDMEKDYFDQQRNSIQQNFQIPCKKAANDISHQTKNYTNKLKMQLGSTKAQTDMHTLHQAYRTLRKRSDGSGSNFNSKMTGSAVKLSSAHKRTDSVQRAQTDYQSTHHSDGISSIHKVRGLSGEYSQNFEMESFEQLSQCLDAGQSFVERETVVAEEYVEYPLEFIHNPAVYVTREKPALKNHSKWNNQPTFAKLEVMKPEFFRLPRKLLNDDMIPYNDEEITEFEYLDLGSYTEKAEPKEVIQEVDEDDYNESLLIKQPLTSSRISASSFNKERQDRIQPTGSIMIINPYESAAFNPSCFCKGPLHNVKCNQSYKGNLIYE